MIGAKYLGKWKTWVNIKQTSTETWPPVAKKVNYYPNKHKLYRFTEILLFLNILLVSVELMLWSGVSWNWDLGILIESFVVGSENLITIFMQTPFYFMIGVLLLVQASIGMYILMSLHSRFGEYESVSFTPIEEEEG